MRNFPKIALLLIVLATLFFACSKEITPEPNTIPDLSLYEEITLTPLQLSEADTHPNSASTRGVCGAFAVRVEYPTPLEYEFDINFAGFAGMHFASNPSGSTKIIPNMPVAVQPRQISLSNKPNAKQNPKCPWITGEQQIKIKIFRATKNANGTWEPVKDTYVLTYVLGSTKPNAISKWGTRTYCLDKPIGQWYFCSLSQL